MSDGADRLMEIGYEAGLVDTGLARLQVRRARLAVEPEWIGGVACCAECGEELGEHRVVRGRCVPCAERVEARGRMYGGA